MPLSDFLRSTLVFALLFVAADAQAQKKNINPDEPRPTEKEVMLEKTYIEATREKLLGNYDAALGLYQEVLQKDNENAAASYEMARIYELKKNLDEALPRAERAHFLDKKNLYYAQYFGGLLDKKGDYRRAAELYEELAEMQPIKEEFFVSWAYYLIKLDKQDQAIKVYNQLESKTKVSVENSNRKYKLYLSLNKLKPAEKELTQLTKVLPDNAAAWLLLARHYKNTKQAAEAQAAYKKVLEFQPTNSEANIELANTILASGDELAYLRALSAIFDSPDHAAEDKNKLLQPIIDKVIMNSNRPNSDYLSTLTALSQKNAMLSPDSYSAHYMQGSLLEYNGQFEAAFAAYLLALNLHKNSLPLWESTLNMALLLDDRKELAIRAADFVELFPNNPQPYFYQATALSKNKNYKDAISSLEQGKFMLSAVPLYQAYFEAAFYRYYLAQGNTEKANTSYTKALAAFEKAAEEANKSQFKTQFEWQWAQLLFAKGDYAGCQNKLKTALGLANPVPAVLELHGDACFKLGQAAPALDYWQRAAKAGSRSPNLPAKINQKTWLEN
jgi:tetratricopeptide (TPR) repeat protein